MSLFSWRVPSDNSWVWVSKSPLLPSWLSTNLSKLPFISYNIIFHLSYLLSSCTLPFPATCSVHPCPCYTTRTGSTMHSSVRPSVHSSVLPTTTATIATSFPQASYYLNPCPVGHRLGQGWGTAVPGVRHTNKDEAISSWQRGESQRMEKGRMIEWASELVCSLHSPGSGVKDAPVPRLLNKIMKKYVFTVIH